MLKLFGAMTPSLGFAQEGAGGGEAGGAAEGAQGGESGGGESGGAADAEGGAAGEQGGGAAGDEGSGQGGSQEGAQGGEQGADTPDFSTPEKYLEFVRQNGAFEKADEYKIPTQFEGIETPAGWDVSGDATLFAEMAAKHGLLPHQAEGIFRDYVSNVTEITKATEQADLEAQKPETVLKEVYGDKAQEALPMLERGLKALGIDASKGLRVTHAMKAITELGRLTGEDGSFHGAGAGGGEDEEMSTEEWLKQAMK
ncbi:hypothetical protein [Halodesulfovibrio spirochaetisodalis]|uniref:hypothetical protein n=1 Tax=Halodesulfovibrio spirochaetisodalis TaxID=1560234 RepID=UPI000832209F|nr:hypothetical protein [Halodesulfovibrio spirochaetisodalis]